MFLPIYDIVRIHIRYFAQNFDWLHEQLGEIEDDYIFIDCPGKQCICTRQEFLNEIGRSYILHMRIKKNVAAK